MMYRPLFFLNIYTILTAKRDFVYSGLTRAIAAQSMTALKPY
jgi:hypothetical protein